VRSRRSAHSPSVDKEDAPHAVRVQRAGPTSTRGGRGAPGRRSRCRSLPCHATSMAAATEELGLALDRQGSDGPNPRRCCLAARAAAPRGELTAPLDGGGASQGKGLPRGAWRCAVGGSGARALRQKPLRTRLRLPRAGTCGVLVGGPSGSRAQISARAAERLPGDRAGRSERGASFSRERRRGASREPGGGGRPKVRPLPLSRASADRSCASTSARGAAGQSAVYDEATNSDWWRRGRAPAPAIGAVRSRASAPRPTLDRNRHPLAPAGGAGAPGRPPSERGSPWSPRLTGRLREERP
jgi:hypothetical protein